MLDGWFCRTMASAEQQEQIPQTSEDEDDKSSEEDESNQSLSQLNQKSVDHKAQYQNLKKKLKYLLYENEFFQDSLRSSQRRLLKVTRDRSFLLDRLHHYEKPEISSSESDNTETSEDDENSRNSIAKRRMESTGGTVSNHNSAGKTPNQAKRKRPPQKKNIHSAGVQNILADGHMTVEERREVERHLQSRQSLMAELPEMHVLPTVPTEMFSNEPSLDSVESNDQLIENSPSNDCLLSVHEIMQE